MSLAIKYIILFIVLLQTGCSVRAYRQGDYMVLKGYGAKSAKWADGSEISRTEPVAVPTIPILR